LLSIQRHDDLPMKPPTPPKRPGRFKLWLERNNINIVLMTLTFVLLFNGLVIHQARSELQEIKHAIQAAGSESLNMSNANTSVLGKYNGKFQLIRVWGYDRPMTDVMDTAIHELGHYLDDRHIYTPGSAEYNRIFNTTDEFVSDYSKTKVTEDFAETFEEGVQYCFNLSKIPEDRRHFFKTRILPHIPECEVNHDK